MEFSEALLQTAMRRLASVYYHKILLVDLTEDSFFPIKIGDEEWKSFSAAGGSSKISEYFNWFAESDFCNESDREDFCRFADVEYLKKLFVENEYQPVIFRYRRKVSIDSEDFRIVRMELIPDENDSGHQMVTLFIRDITEENEADFQAYQKAQAEARHDKLTHLLNRFSFDDAIKKLEEEERPVSVVFSDINALKYTNDNFGHAAGDLLIRRFADVLIAHFRPTDVFRISGDEFVVLIPGISEENMKLRLDQFREHVNALNPPIAAVGFCRAENGKDTVEAVKVAETDMYEDKKRFYENYSEFRR